MIDQQLQQRFVGVAEVYQRRRGTKKTEVCHRLLPGADIGGLSAVNFDNL